MGKLFSHWSFEEDEQKNSFGYEISAYHLIPKFFGGIIKFSEINIKESPLPYGIVSPEEYWSTGKYTQSESVIYF